MLYKLFQYIGTFSLDVDVLARKSDSIRDNLNVLKAGYNAGCDVLLTISLTGITVTSGSSHQAVIMTHPIKRISYATCDPASCLFSFMARDPTSPLHLQQCHTFRLSTPRQAEELNTIVGTAFRVAYALQMEREKEAVITSWSAEDLLRLSDKTPLLSLSSTTSAMCLVQTDEACRKNARVMDRLNCLDRRQTVSPADDDCHSSSSSQVVTCPVYSQVFDQDNLDSMAQDSGISSTSDSTISYPSRDKHQSMDIEDLNKAPWYQAEMQR